MDWIISIIIAIISLIVGIAIGRFLLQKVLKDIESDAREKSDLILKEARATAENIKKDQQIEGNKFLKKLQSDQEREYEKKKNQLQSQENRVKSLQSKTQQHESKLQLKEAEIERLQKSLEDQQIEVKLKLADLDSELSDAKDLKFHLEKDKKELDIERESIRQIHSKHLQELEKISGLSAAEAKAQIVELITDEAKSEALVKSRHLIEEAKLTATKESKRIVLTTIQRTATEHTIENCVSVFNLDSDEIKGKIIGREGRNIRALEAATGVEIIVDDTPEAITISGFDPIRREIARLSLHKLVADGRIHPARIEEVVAKTQTDIEEQIIEVGERTVIELGIHGLHPELIRLVGKMRFRSSYGQNLLQHSKEVARLAASMAAELGLNAKLAKRAGLLHDIGKVYSDEPETPHALLGMELAIKYNEHPEVCNAIGAHHDEIEMTSTISPIIQACDAISGSRPGARRETMESYLQRLHDLEDLAKSYPGVSKCYAIQAGRELRVIVDSEIIDDEKADNLSFDIAQKIEKEMQYPGQIRVTVIREKRAVQYAK